MSGHRWLAPLAFLLLAGCSASPPDGGSDGRAGLPGSNGAGGQDNNAILRLPTIPTPAASVSPGAEPSILADRDGRHVWIGDTSGAYVTANNGTSWSAMATYLGDFGLAFGDGVALAQSDTGTLYGAFLHDNRVDVAKSSNGQTFGTPAYAAGVSGTADRPWLAARGEDVAMFYFDAPLVVTGFFEHCARSTNGGLAFPERNPLAAPPTGGNAFYDADGNFYFSNNDGNLYRYTTCLSGSPVSMIPSPGINQMIQGDAEGKDLYMVAATGGAAAITLAGRRDGGSLSATTVSPPELKANTYATVSVHERQVAVAWYGSTAAGDPSDPGFSGNWDVWLAVVDDFFGSPKVRHYKVTDSPNHEGWICMSGVGCLSGGRELLDYFMIDYDKWGGLHVAWVDSHGTGGVKYKHVPPHVMRNQPPPGGGPGGPVLEADFAATVDGLSVAVDAGASRGASGFGWDWGDGSKGSGILATHTYDGPGSYRIRLTATDGARTDTHDRTVKLTAGPGGDQPPLAGFTFEPQEPRAGQVVRFRDASTDDAGIAQLAWDFGDGAHAEGGDVTHTFDKPGTYAVRLTVTDTAGSTDVAEQDVTVAQYGGSTATGTGTGAATKAPGVSAVLGSLALLGAALAVRRITRQA